MYVVAENVRVRLIDDIRDLVHVLDAALEWDDERENSNDGGVYAARRLHRALEPFRKEQKN